MPLGGIEPADPLLSLSGYWYRSWAYIHVKNCTLRQHISPKTAVILYQITRQYLPEDSIIPSHPSQNFKSNYDKQLNY